MQTHKYLIAPNISKPTNIWIPIYSMYKVRDREVDHTIEQQINLIVARVSISYSQRVHIAFLHFLN